MLNPTSIFRFALTILLVSGFSGCNQTDDSISLADGRRATDRGRSDVTGDSFAVEAGEYYFEPTILEGTPGQRIDLVISNQGNQPHNFSMRGGSIDEDIGAGSFVKVTVVFPVSGSRTFECDLHRPQRMRGELTVSS